MSIETGTKNLEEKRKLKENSESKFCSSQENENNENQIVKEKAKREIREGSIEGTGIIAEESNNTQEVNGKSKINIQLKK